MPAAVIALLLAALPPSLPLDTASLARLPRATATLTAHGQTHSCDGVWLADLAAAEDGPLRLVVPGEARAARSVRQLQALRIQQVP
jgi:hypothetical protein